MMYWLLFYILMPFYSLLAMENNTNYDIIYANSWLDMLQADITRISKTVAELQKYPEEWINEETITEEAELLVNKITNSESFKKFAADPTNERYIDYRNLFLKSANEQRLLKSVIAGIPQVSTDPKLKHNLEVICCADVKMRKILRQFDTKDS